MSRLVRLFPEAWRQRYEIEFLALLEERPLTAVDRLDTVRSAVDAHLHPQADDASQPWTHRLPGLFALMAGALWSAGFIAFVFLGERAWELAVLIPLSMLLMFMSLPGDYMAAHARRIAMSLGVIGLCIVVANFPYSLPTAVAAIAGYLIALAGVLTLAAIRAGIGTSGRLTMVVLGVLLPALIGFPVAMGLGNLSVDAGGSWILALLLPYGVSWFLVGLRLAIRGSATLIDLPANPTEPEVHAA
jgi:hypothetical protein